MPLIFSYGTLQEEPVQLATFGRVLEGVPDSLVGYERVSLTFTDPALIATSGKAVHANLDRRASGESRVAGTCLTVTEDELAICDGYERLASYRRQWITLESGKQAWVYTFSALRPWDDLNAGMGCPLCAPRPDHSEFHDLVRKLSVSSLYLVKEQAYRGTCGLVFDPRHVTRLDQLTSQEWLAFSQDLARAEAAVHAAVRPDHINIESLGMTVPHLHWHIIPRYRSDPRWGGPIWTNARHEMARTRLGDSEQRALVEQIGTLIDERAV